MHPSTSRTVLILACVAALEPASLVAQAERRPAQAQSRAARPGSVTVEEATELTNGWALLAEGRTGDALARAERVLTTHPRSIAGLALAIEAAIAERGGLAALSRYEQWLGQRTLEEPSVLRRIARAVLSEEGVQTTDQVARVEALRALGADGDVQAARDAADAVTRVSLPPSTRAALGDEQAVRALVAELKRAGPGQVQAIEALAASGSELAVPALVDRLQDPRQEVRAAALDALGRLGDTSVIPRVAPFMSDSSMRVRVMAAGALLRLGDYSGIQLLQGLMADPSPATRLLAAEALASRPDPSWDSQVRELASADDPEIRAAAARLLGPHDPEFARSVLESLANDANPAIRELAEFNLGEVVTTDLATLRALLRTPSHLTRARAAAQVLAVTK